MIEEQNRMAGIICVQTVADRDVDEAEHAADGHRGFGTLLCQREEARAPTAAENEREHLAVHGHRRDRRYIDARGACDGYVTVV
jgi:hypothetical protein